MQDLALIATIDKITPIPKYDRIVIATICNYNVIVAKDEYKVGDKCIYIFVDTLIPIGVNKAFDEDAGLRKRCYSPKYNACRIKAMKLGGVVSEGIAYPMSILPEGDYKVGMAVDKILGITKYDPEAEAEAKIAQTYQTKHKGLVGWLMRFKWFRNLVCRPIPGYPDWVVKSDETNIEKLFGEDFSLDKKGPWYITEKMEGMATSYIYDYGKFWICSHNKGTNSGAWVEFAKSIGLEKRIKQYCKKFKIKRLCVQGELCGPGIQRNIYGFKNLVFFMYGGFIGDKKSTRRITVSEMHAISFALEINEVPYIKVMDEVPDLDTILADADGKSVVAPTVLREGLVYRDESGNRHFKAKSREYKVWFTKKE